MLTITVQIDAPAWEEIGIKETLAALLERYGDVKVVSIAGPRAVQLGLTEHR